MYRNLQSHFASLPSADIRRTRMNRDCSIKTSFNVGEVIPFYIDEVLPADSMQIKTNLVVRMQPLVTSPLDDLWLDTYYFYVPSRLVYEHWEELNGENKDSAWAPTVEYNVPQLVSGENGFEIGSIADYFGLPVGVPNLSVSALPFRAYSKIMNDWFRDENLVDPLETPMDDAQQTYYPLSSAYNPAQYANGGKPFIAAKAHDYFTSALPAPQRGVAVEIPGIASVPDTLSVFGNGKTLGLTDGNYLGGMISSPASAYTLMQGTAYYGKNVGTTNSGQSTNISNKSLGVPTKAQVGSTPENTGLIADSSTIVSNSITINDLRQCIAIQQLLEVDARNGGRYTEVLHAHFGVQSPDARLQRPEYLGGNRIAINVNQVVQNSASVENSPLGNVAGMSLTSDQHGDFFHSFVEHGFIIGLCVARYAHTYQQGIERFWSRKTRWDFYWPGLANLGEMAILNKEIYATGTAADDDVFAYQEAWGDYRYKPSRVTAEMRSGHDKTLDSWHFADDYSSQPYLSAEWIQEDKNNVDRALAVTSSVSNQLFADFFVQNESTRPMPMYSIPGLERI